MAIIQNITAMPTPALSRTMQAEAFITASDADIVARGNLVTELNAFATQANATAAAMNLNSTTDTSATSNSIATGAKTFTVTAGKSFQPGMWLIIADTAAPSTNQMLGSVNSYATDQLVMNITSIIGSGTKTAWTISQSAASAISAEYISNTPAGSIAATTVQAAINELDTEKAALAGSASQAFSAAALTASGNITIISPALLGYDTGAGGTVTQSTDKSTAVTLNKPCGQIMMNNAALASGAIVWFTLNNSLVSPTDLVVVNVQWNALTNPTVYSVSAAPYEVAGSIMVALKNESAGSLSNAVVLNYAIIKGVVS